MSVKQIAALATFASLLGTTVAAQAAEPFDILCEVEFLNRPVLSQNQSWSDNSYVTNETIRIRIDLQNRRYCVGDCMNLYSQVEGGPEVLVVNDNRLYFGFKTQDAWPGAAEPGWGANLDLNRRSGIATISASVLPVGLSASFSHVVKSGTGQCRREPFSGFPAAIF